MFRTVLSWPSRAARGLPVAASHSRASLSPATVASVLPSGANASVVTIVPGTPNFLTSFVDATSHRWIG